MRAKTRICAFLLLLCCLGLAARDDPYSKYEGFYVFIGDKPAVVSTLDNFVITEFSAERLTGRVIPKEGRVYEFKTARIADGALSFETRAVNGVSYSFKGQFLTAPPSPKDGHTPVLEGTMRRIKNGAPAGEAKVRFAFSEGGEG